MDQQKLDAAQIIKLITAGATGMAGMLTALRRFGARARRERQRIELKEAAKAIVAEALNGEWKALGEWQQQTDGELTRQARQLNRLEEASAKILGLVNKIAREYPTRAAGDPK